MDFGLLTHPDLLFQEAGLRGDDLDSTCHLRYQQALVNVYARFVIPDGLNRQYLVHRKASFKVTEEMTDRLRVADVSIAKLRENIVEGVKPGSTEVQVGLVVGHM